jgi:serine protease
MLRAWLLVPCAATFALFPVGLAALTSEATGGGESARVIVKFRAESALLRAQSPSAGAERADRAGALGRRLGMALTAGSAVSERSQVVFASGIGSRALAQRLALEPDVEYASPDVLRRRHGAPNDPLYLTGQGALGPAVGQWYLRAPADTIKSSLDIERAWSVTEGSPGIVVAVVDTGVRYDHPDLLSVAAGGNLLPGYDMITDVELANDGDGREADASDPGDWVTAAEANASGGTFFGCTAYDPSTRKYVAEDSSWHGTKVTGIIAALANNGIGMAGVGPRLHVLPMRALGKCGMGFDSDIIPAVRWAAGLVVAGVAANPNRARVINLSLGEDSECTAAWQDVVNEVNAAGSVVVASAGNSAGHSVGSPGNCEGVVTVAALRHVGTKVGFSDVGHEIAIGAPGGNCVNTSFGAPCLYPILTTSNSGTTGPASPTYTDSYDYTLGTSFATPLVAGTAGLVLAAQPALTPIQVRFLLQATARPFPTTGGDNGDGTPVPQCTAPQYNASGNPIDQLQCYCTIDTCGAGMLDAGAAVVAAKSGSPPPGMQAQGLWWRLPAASESGWGINLAHQGNAIFATWFTYDVGGKAWWLSMTALKTGSSPETYTGDLIATRGPAFSAVPFNPGQVTRTVVGTGTLTFPDYNHGRFEYTVNGVHQTKSLTRQVFGALPACAYGVQPDFVSATNYQDLWWVANGAESGWGINLTHQGSNIFATWFTYDTDGAPLWLSVTAAKTGSNTYSGELIRTAGPSFAAVPFEPAFVTRSVVGTATLTFASGNAATFAYTVNGISQSKAITRQLFGPPAGTLCRNPEG